MARIFQMEIDPATAHEHSALQKLVQKADQRFQELSEEEQILSLLAQKISHVSGGTYNNKEGVAKSLITGTHGPKFADRVLGNPELRKKLGLSEISPLKAH